MSDSRVPSQTVAGAAGVAFTGPDLQLQPGKTGVEVVWDITAVPGVETQTLAIQGKDPQSGKYYDVLVSAAQVATGTIRMRIQPGIAAVANLAANDNMPPTYRFQIRASATGNFTSSLSCRELP